MTLKLVSHSALALLAASVVTLTAVSAEAQTRPPREAPVGAPNSVANKSYQSGPRTRVYITTRSWLDMGTEVLPGDRKYTDYALPLSPSPYYTNTQPFGLAGPRQPTNPSFDMGGYPRGIPLY